MVALSRLAESAFMFMALFDLALDRVGIKQFIDILVSLSHLSHEWLTGGKCSLLCNVTKNGFALVGGECPTLLTGTPRSLGH